MVSEFYPKKIRLKTPATCKVIGLWLRFYATNGMRAYFLCCIAKSNDIKHFFVILQGREQLAIAIWELWLQEAMTTTSIFLCHVTMSKQWQLHFLHHIVREWTTIQQYLEHCETRGVAKVWWPPNSPILYMLLITRSNNHEQIFMCIAKEVTTIIFWCHKKWSYCKGASNAMTISQPLWDARTQQSIIMYAVSCKDGSNKHCQPLLGLKQSHRHRWWGIRSRVQLAVVITDLIKKWGVVPVTLLLSG